MSAAETTVSQSTIEGDLILTGASRGIGRALALELAPHVAGTLFLVARDQVALAQVSAEVVARGGKAQVVTADLSSVAGGRQLAAALKERVRPGATLVHNAGLWPESLQHTAEGLERSFAVNFVAPLAFQDALLPTGLVRRVLVVGAGLMVKARYDAHKTPTGQDFSWWRTYCNTKLAFAVASRAAAREYPHIDFLVIHPGVVNTELGLPGGLLGRLVRFLKRGWERPEVCAERLTRILQRPRWSPAGEARWLNEEKEEAWPAAAEDSTTVAAIQTAVMHYVRKPG
jgi:NAD(P)-dependent dehydrogenase (short-subunit alcohol dehydrogenase family)